MSRRVAVAAIGLADTGPVGSATPYALIAQASRRALAECGLKPCDVDGLASTGLGTMAPIDVAEYLGLQPRWIDSTTVGGTWEVMAAHATNAIAEGRADVVLVTYGSTAKSDLARGLRSANLDWGTRGPQQWEAPYGHTPCGHTPYGDTPCGITPYWDPQLVADEIRRIGRRAVARRRSRRIRKSLVIRASTQITGIRSGRRVKTQRRSYVSISVSHRHCDVGVDSITWECDLPPQRFNVAALAGTRRKDPPRNSRRRDQ